MITEIVATVYICWCVHESNDNSSIAAASAGVFLKAKK